LDQKFAGYSKGMKRKITIAADIIHRPQILFLDEPTTGIDVASARQIRQHISDLNSNGTTIFLTTHYIEEAERLCNRIAFWNILLKDVRSYYLKPPNISWGLLFPLVWITVFFFRSGMGMDTLPDLLPALVALSILFGTTSVLSITVTFEKKGRSFERLLLAPISLELLMLDCFMSA
jgi:hypothetical protein